MRNTGALVFQSAILGLATLALLTARPALAQERIDLAQPAVVFRPPLARVLGAAPIKPPLLFSADTDAMAAQIEAVTSNRQGAGGLPGAPFYRGYGGWYGPGYGFGSYGYFGAPFAGFWSGWFRPYGYLNFSPYAYGFGQPLGSIYDFPAAAPDPYYASAARPPFLGTTIVAYPPYGLGTFGGSLYW